MKVNCQWVSFVFGEHCIDFVMGDNVSACHSKGLPCYLTIALLTTVSVARLEQFSKINVGAVNNASRSLVVACDEKQAPYLLAFSTSVFVLEIASPLLRFKIHADITDMIA